MRKQIICSTSMAPSEIQEDRQKKHDLVLSEKHGDGEKLISPST
ncbi:hypothetical protein [Halomonas sp. 25-S5]|nr:hypothetical protein [Halomonas sp. 25-S5]